MSLCSSLGMSDSDTYSRHTIIQKSPERYRVRVCLRNYFSDERERCFVLVHRRRSVRWLEQRLRELFDLREGFWLRSRGYLLPSAESLAVLNPDDPIEVIPAIDGRPSMQVSKIPDIVGLKTPNNNILLKEKNTLVVNTPSLKEKHYSCQGKNVEVEQGTNDVLSGDNGHLDIFKKRALALLNEKYGEINEDFEQTEKNNGEQVNEEFEYPAKKRRRVRHRKRNSKLPTDSDEAIEAAEAAEVRIAHESPGDAVTRNRAASPRAPRLVHSTL